MLTRSRNGFRYNQPTCIAESTDRFNCPRLTVIDNNLWIICDKVKQSEDFIGAENDESKTRVILWCSNNGSEWSMPIETNITGILPDRMCQTDDGGFLIATHTKKKQEGAGFLIQNVWKAIRSPHLSTWIKYKIADEPSFNFCEGSICNGGGELLCLMRENSQRGEPCFWSSSKSNGVTWSRPMRTRMFGAHRPILGKLSSGNYLTTYREQCSAHSPPFWAKNVFACLTAEKSMHNASRPCKDSIILPLDHDNNRRSDGGYTGWVETEDKQIYIVNYITKDAPKPHIVWYLIEESEF